MPPKEGRFVTRAGEKLVAALEGFAVDVRGNICADFGCNVGGFTDCLLQCGAGKVYAVDTGYGELAWKLRKDPRVVVMERTNALYAPAPEPVDLVVIDVAWTPQELIVPAAMKWLKPSGTVLSLLKPHYELAKMQRRKPHAALKLQQSCAVCMDVCRRLDALGSTVRGAMRSGLLGKGGNVEFFLLLAPPSHQA
jgi:23S rRNA (cytidine1920-2'-O)/16S rRNA (cytidine1409-2'-O)-methyltransferase